jgi:hypothetical protein
MSDNNGDSWKEWSNFVLKELERLNDKLEKIETVQGEIKVSLATLQTSFNIKSGIWGALAGLIPAIGVLIYTLVKKP